MIWHQDLLATGVIDMRAGFDGLTAERQSALERPVERKRISV
jgi:hypothetical protein